MARLREHLLQSLLWKSTGKNLRLGHYRRSECWDQECGPKQLLQDHLQDHLQENQKLRLWDRVSLLNLRLGHCVTLLRLKHRVLLLLLLSAPVHDISDGFCECDWEGSIHEIFFRKAD